MRQKHRYVIFVLTVLVLTAVEGSVADDIAGAQTITVNRQPTPAAANAWELFQEENPGAKIIWGRKVQRPFVLYGFEPIETNGDYETALLDFLESNAGLFGLDEKRPGADYYFCELGAGEVVYSCNRDEMEPLPGFRDGEWIEPQCVENTVVRFPQYVGGYEIVDGALTATFDKNGRLSAVQGEFFGWIEADLDPVVNLEGAQLIIEDYFDVVAGQVTIDHAEQSFRWVFGLVPVWTVDLYLDRDVGPAFLRVDVNANTGEVLNVEDFVDQADVKVYGWAMRNKAAYICNEPTLKDHWVDNSFFSSGRAAPFNDKIHVYDFTTLSGTVFYPTYSSGNYLVLWKYFNHRCDPADPDPTGSTCQNDQNNTITIRDISVFTEFSALVTAYNYATNLGFDRNDGSLWATNQPLIAIVNDNNDNALCCAGNTVDCSGSCFTSSGYPQTPVAGSDWFFPSVSADRYTGSNHIPTISVTGNAVYETYGESDASFYRPTGYVTTLHEFYHWVVRTYMTEGGYTFLSDE